MTKQIDACCTSPAAMCYWLTVSLIAWGMLSLIGIYWRPVHASSGFTCLFAMAIGCFANWLRNRSFHCAITGPLFLLAGVVLLALRRAHGARHHRLDLVTSFHRNRHRISVGMAVCEAPWLSAKRNQGDLNMRVTEKLTPVAAAMSALATLACCLPLGIAGAVGALGLSVALETLTSAPLRDRSRTCRPLAARAG